MILSQIFSLNKSLKGTLLKRQAKKLILTLPYFPLIEAQRIFCEFFLVSLSLSQIKSPPRMKSPLFLGGHCTVTALSFLSLLPYFHLSQIPFVNCELPKPIFASSNGFSANETTHLNAVYISLHRLSGTFQDSFNLMASEIEATPGNDTRPTRASPCYTEISRILRQGFNTEWTAKCK